MGKDATGSESTEEAVEVTLLFLMVSTLEGGRAVYDALKGRNISSCLNSAGEFFKTDSTGSILIRGEGRRVNSVFLGGVEVKDIGNDRTKSLFIDTLGLEFVGRGCFFPVKCLFHSCNL